MTTLLLTPENIQNQQFHVRFRGFDVDEVDAFLEKVAENYLVLVKDNEKLRDAMTAIQGERDQVQSQERTFKNAIISAQNIADEMQKKAQQEALVLKENARLEAAALIDEAKAQQAELKLQISSLLLEKQKLKEELQTFLQTHMDRLDSQYPTVGQVGGGGQPPAEAAVRPSIIGDIGNSRQAAPKQEVAPLEEEQEPVFREIPEEASDSDLADLYEKIDLSEIGDDGLVEPTPATHPSAAAGHKKSATQFASDALADMELTMPDLDGDMLFTLDDPLDDQANSDIVIDPLKMEKNSLKNKI